MKKTAIFIIIAIILINPLLFKTGFAEIFPFAQYIDEMLGVFSFFWICKNWNKISNYERKIVYFVSLLLLVGLFCSYQHQVQTGLFPIVMDAFQCTKCFISFICFNHVIFDMKDRDKIFIINRVNKVLPLFMVIAFIFAMLNLFSDIGMHNTVRFGLRAFGFICDKSGTFSDQIFFYLLFLGTGFMISRNKAFYKLVIILTLITWMLTLRTRSIVYAPIFFFMFYYYVIKKNSFKRNYVTAILIVIILFCFGADKIEYTYAHEEAGPRAAFLYSGIMLLINYFPLGVGFATFGTDMAAKNYSSLYYDLGFHHHWGMTPDDPRYLHDTYWPAIMGEFGFVGVVIIAIILFFIFKEIKEKYSDNRLSITLAFFVLFTMYFNSTATPVFFISYTVYLFMLLPLTYLKTLKKK